MVGRRREKRPVQDRHVKDYTREFQAWRFGWRDEGHGGEDDVRSAAEGDGEADERRGAEDGFIEEVPAAAS